MSADSGGHDHRSACVNLVPIFAGLPEQDRNRLAAIALTREYARAEQVYGAGDEPGLLIVHRGRVKVLRVAESGAQQLVRLLGPGEFLGETAVLSDRPADDFAVAVEDAEVCVVRRSAMRGLLETHPDVAVRMLETVSGRLRSAEQLLASFSGESVAQRLAAHLLQLAEEESTRRVRLRSSKKDLASFLGTSPETLSRRLASFEDAGLISLGPGRLVEIRDEAGLRGVLTAADPA